MDSNLLEEVERFIYLENVMNKQGGIDADIRIRIGKAWMAFHQLNNIWGPMNLYKHKSQALQHHCWSLSYFVVQIHGEPQHPTWRELRSWSTAASEVFSVFAGLTQSAPKKYCSKPNSSLQEMTSSSDIGDGFTTPSARPLSALQGKCSPGTHMRILKRVQPKNPPGAVS